jgi:hypothetical protein
MTPKPEGHMASQATLRSSAGVPAGFRATGNPGGPGHQWVKARYIDPAPLGNRLIRDEQTGPSTAKSSAMVFSIP